MKRGAHCRRWQLRQALRLAMRTSAFVPGPVRSAGSAGWWADLQVLECSRAHVFGRAAGARRSDRGQTRKADAEAVLQPHDLVWLETPRNPMCEVYDIAAFANLSCRPAVVVDGTFAPPPMQSRSCYKL